MQPRTIALIALGVAALAAASGLSHQQESGAVRLELPAVLESTQVPSELDSVQAPGGLDVTVSPSVLAFPQLRPGQTSAPIEVSVQNLGVTSVRVQTQAEAMVDAATGAAFPAEALEVFAARPTADALPAPLATEIAPGSTMTFWVRLHAPSGAEQYVPAGDYRGSLALLFEEVSA